MKDGDRTLFAKLEARVRRDVETFRGVIRSDSRAVVLAGAGARDVKPVSGYIDGLTEVDGHCRVVRRVEAVRDRISACDPWTKLDDRSRATRIRRTGLKIVAILICVLSAVLFPEQRRRVTRSGRTRATFETTRARAVAHEVNDVRIRTVRTTTAKRDRIADERDLARRRTHVDIASDVCHDRQRRAVRATRGELDEEILTRSDRAAEWLFVGPARTRRRRILQRPAGEIERDTGRVVNLDVIVRERRTGVAAATVKLADDKVVHRLRWLLNRQTDRAGGRASLAIGDAEGK